MDLSRDVALHDDPNSKKHARDVANKALRDKTDWVPVPALARESGASKSRDGVSPSPPASKGFSFRILGGTAIKADGKEYTKRALKRSRELRRWKITRLRDGKEVTDYTRRKEGIESLVATIAPWADPTIRRLGESEREHLFLHLASQIAREVPGVFGGGLHADTAIYHFHLHLEKLTPKASRNRAGPWSCGSQRIADKFPKLLTPHKKELLNENLSKKNADLIDIKITRIIDRETEAWIKECPRRQKQYEKDCEAYVAKKTKSQKAESVLPLMKAAMLSFQTGGVWPLAYAAMSLTMWRLVPKEYRKAVILSIRAFQVVRKVLTPKPDLDLLPHYMPRSKELSSVK
jgi:hypothetical protein